MPNLSQKSNVFWAYFCMSVSGFLLFAGYSIIRSSTPTLFIAAFGKENLPLAMTVMVFVTLFAVAIYSKLLTFWGARKTFHGVTIFSLFMLLICYFGIKANYPIFSAIIHIYKDVYIVLIVEQLWSFLNSTVSFDMAKKYNGPLMGLMSVGPILGGQMVRIYAESVGTINLFLVTFILLIPIILVMEFAYRKCGEPQPTKKEKQAHLEGKRSDLGLDVFRERPQLLFLLFVVLLSQMVAATTTLRVQGFVTDVFALKDQQTAYYGQYYSIINGASAAAQFIIMPIFFSLFSIKMIHIGIPLVHLCTIGLAIVHPTLETVSLAGIVFKSFDYSLFRGAKELVYVPLSFDARYRAKEMIDVFGYRFGKGTIAGVVALGRKFAGLTEAGYSIVALGAVGIWFLFSFKLTNPKK